jgi:hypothetical protein
VLRQAMKTIESIIRLTHRGTDLTFEAIPIHRRSRGISVEFALTSRDVLCSLVGVRLIGTGR